MMNTQQQYDKIQQFVKQQYAEISDRGIPVVKSVTGGYLVGNLLVKPLTDGWQILNKTGRVLHNIKQRRIAILLAALINNRKYEKAQLACSLDSRYDIFLGDYRLYSTRIQQNPDNYVYVDRFNRADGELESLNRQIAELEKTANLQ
jgi:hypothetical protein